MDSFFGIGLPELVLILLVAGIVMGPERIAVAARWLGRTSSQLQAIAHGFMQQINSELDDLTGSEDVREALREVQDLKGQLTQMQNDLRAQANGLAAEGKRAVATTKEEAERTIAPAAFTRPTPGLDDDVPVKPLPPEALPKRLEVDDDPD